MAGTGNRKRKLSVGALYLIVLGVLIAGTTAFALLYGRGGMPLVSAEVPSPSPEPEGTVTRRPRPPLSPP